MARTEEEWGEVARAALLAYVKEAGAAVWPEIVSALAESDWVHANVDRTIGPTQGPQPHHLAHARNRLLASNDILVAAETLSGREVAAYVDGTRRLAKTELRRTAATKRRLYRSYLGWAGNKKTCGDVAEQIVLGAAKAAAGRTLWVPSQSAGNVKRLGQHPIPIGPIDFTGHWALDPDDPNAGFIRFGGEVKNIRAWVYPWHNEVWGILAKLGAFPDTVPVLVARRIHVMTFRMFKDLGVVGLRTNAQYFGTSIDADRFRRVTNALRLTEVEQREVDAIPPRMRTFFESTLSKHSLIPRAADRWKQIALVAQRYSDLRQDRLTYTDRWYMFRDFAREVRALGLYDTQGWGPTEAMYDEEALYEDELDYYV